MSVQYYDNRSNKYYIDAGILEYTFYRRILKNKLLILDCTIFPSSEGQLIDFNSVKKNIVPINDVEFIPQVESDIFIPVIYNVRESLKDFDFIKNLGKTIRYHGRFTIVQFDMDLYFYSEDKDLLITKEEMLDDMEKHFQFSKSMFKNRIEIFENDYCVTLK